MANDILWSESAVGDLTPGVNVALVKDEPGLLILHQGAPDWVSDPETGEPVRVARSSTWEHFDCRACGAHVAGPVLVMFHPSTTRKGTWFTYGCPACRKWVRGLRSDREEIKP